MEYKVVRMGRDEELVVEVNAKIAIGWECQGGVGHSGQAFFQAMIRKDENIPKPKPIPKTADIKKPSPRRKRVRAGETGTVKK